MLSLRAMAFTMALGLLRPWRSVRDEAALKASIAAARRRPPSEPSMRTRRKHKVSSEIIEGRKVVTIEPAKSGPGVILFLHGGCYTFEALAVHWSFADRMAGSLAMKVVVPAYPLAPEHDVAEALAFVRSIHARLQVEHGSVIVVGDSAGGGLALAMIQAMVANQSGLPDGLVLISPWLDGRVDDPDQITIEMTDPALRREGLRAAAQLYAGRAPVEDLRVSPIDGPLAGLPPTLVFAGGRDLLVTDARRWAARARAYGLPVEYLEQASLFHDWPLLPLPESKQALSTLQTFIRELNKSELTLVRV